SLEGFCSTIELHPQEFMDSRQLLQLMSGGGGWIRTNVGVSQQIYSLPPLATRAPLRRELRIMGERPLVVKTCLPFQSQCSHLYGGFKIRPKRRNPTFAGWGFCSLLGSLTITYFHPGNPHYHRRGVVSRSCSGWEGVGPTRYGHQA